MTYRALAAALLLAACAATPDASWEVRARERGAGVIAPFKQRLLAELTQGLAPGPEHALEVCRARAPQIAAEASLHGARVGRTSHKLRNPENRAPAWVEPLLASYVAGESLGEVRVVRLPRGRAGYVEPIRVAPLCLTCHGDSLAPALRVRLAALYPDDHAVGFHAGDFRGLFWAELPRE